MVRPGLSLGNRVIDGSLGDVWWVEAAPDAWSPIGYAITARLGKFLGRRVAMFDRLGRRGSGGVETAEGGADLTGFADVAMAWQVDGIAVTVDQDFLERGARTDHDDW